MPHRMLFVAFAFALAGTTVAHAETSQPAPAALSAANAVSPVALPAGVTSTLRLETNPSTGYAWQVVEVANLRVDEPFEISRDPATPNGMVGAPESAAIRITPRGKGPASLKLVYKQAWRDTTPDDKTLSFVFVVE